MDISFIRTIMPVLTYFQKSTEARDKKLLERKITHISPKEIKTRCDVAPEFNRRGIEKSFKGIKVKWHVKFNAIVNRKFFGTKGTIMCQYSDDIFYSVNIMLKFEDYPEIKIANKNDSFWVTGIIHNVELTSIYIKPIEIEKAGFFVF
jgi:hypothetical protein